MIEYVFPDNVFPPYVASLYVGGLLSAFVIVLIVLAVVTFADTAQGHRLIRRSLNRRLERSRLFWMLRRRGVVPSHFVAQFPIADIRSHLRNCHRCANTIACDKALRRDRGMEDWSFCPNHRVISQVLTSARSGELALNG